jgi:hypothetical protein
LVVVLGLLSLRSQPTKPALVAHTSITLHAKRSARIHVMIIFPRIMGPPHRASKIAVSVDRDSIVASSVFISAALPARITPVSRPHLFQLQLVKKTKHKRPQIFVCQQNRSSLATFEERCLSGLL